MANALNHYVYTGVGSASIGISGARIEEGTTDMLEITLTIDAENVLSRQLTTDDTERLVLLLTHDSNDHLRSFGRHIGEHIGSPQCDESMPLLTPCLTCSLFLQVLPEDSCGWCRRYPPFMHTKENATRWPFITEPPSLHGCGEWRPRLSKSGAQKPEGKVVYTAKEESK